MISDAVPKQCEYVLTSFTLILGDYVSNYCSHRYSCSPLMHMYTFTVYTYIYTTAHTSTHYYMHTHTLLCVSVYVVTQCCQVENVKYQQVKKEKSANIGTLENQQNPHIWMKNEHKSSLFFHTVYFEL